MKVYISGPISSLPREVARENFVKAAKQLIAMGHEPLNPYDVPPWPNCACPAAGSDDTSGTGAHEWACYLRNDLAAMLACDAIAMLSGWEKSHGARLELSVASATGLHVFVLLPGDDSD